jgi:magnesium transporter
VIAILTPQVLADAVRELDSDDVVDLLEDLDAPQQGAILDALEDADRVAVQQAMTYPEYSAGRLMQREVVMAPEHWTVGEAIDYLRNSEDLPDQFYHMVLVDPRLHPVGNVTLGKIMRSRRDVALRDITEEVFHLIPVTQYDGDVAYAFNQYHLISAPVVDDDGRLVGIITIDDAMAVLDEEHEEDILRMAGVSEDSSLSDTILEAAKGRAVWLFVNLLTAILASLVIDAFAETINQMVALAVLMPIVASMGGIAGSQTLTIMIRGLALGQVGSGNARSLMYKEIMVSVMNGMIWSLVVALIAMAWFQSMEIGIIIACAIIINLICAALAGYVIPLGLKRVGIDPALAGSVLLTTITDVVGFMAFLGLGTLYLL